MILDVVKIIIPSVISFLIGIAITPFISDFLYRHKMWKKKARSLAVDGTAAPVFNKLHAHKEVGTPKMGGTIIWISSLSTIFIFWFFSILGGTDFHLKFNFFSRNQTWLPSFTFLVGAIIGLIDDYFEVSGKSDYFAGGLSLKKRLAVVILVSLAGAYWFYVKLSVSSILIPFVGEIALGWFFIPFFMAVMLFIYASGVIDGLDGLAGGVFAIIFSAYGVIAFFQNQIDLAAFSFVIVGGLLAFLWFNIPPARFYMSETGSMALTLTLTVVAFLTKQIAVLPIIAFPLIATVFSNIIQLSSRKLRGGKKVFHSAPMHHHFEALGWPSYKVVMRYWVLTVVFAIFGLVIALIG